MIFRSRFHASRIVERKKMINPKLTLPSPSGNKLLDPKPKCILLRCPETINWMTRAHTAALGPRAAQRHPFVERMCAQASPKKALRSSRRHLGALMRKLNIERWRQARHQQMQQDSPRSTVSPAAPRYDARANQVWALDTTLTFQKCSAWTCLSDRGDHGHPPARQGALYIRWRRPWRLIMRPKDRSGCFSRFGADVVNFQSKVDRGFRSRGLYRAVLQRGAKLSMDGA
jgi:hypothetical protein